MTSVTIGLPSSVPAAVALLHQRMFSYTVHTRMHLRDVTSLDKSVVVERM
jgi:hypothetical protein